jgi:hypothetical protein
MSIEEDFLTVANEKLAENLGRIEACIARLPPHAIWARDSEHENAVGNLLLHLEGNVRQWIVSAIGGESDARDRPSEFAAREGQGGEALVAALRHTVNRAREIFIGLPHARLAEPLSVQGYNTTVLGAIFHVVEHFSGHTYQIILLTKHATREDLNFYPDLAKTGRREGSTV